MSRRKTMREIIDEVNNELRAKELEKEVVWQIPPCPSTLPLTRENTARNIQRLFEHKQRINELDQNTNWAEIRRLEDDIVRIEQYFNQLEASAKSLMERRKEQPWKKIIRQPCAFCDKGIKSSREKFFYKAVQFCSQRCLNKYSNFRQILELSKVNFNV